MLRTLLESGASPTRRAGGTIVSIAVHTTAIALAIAATARATAVKTKADPPRADIVYHVLPSHTETSTNHAAGKPLPGTYIVPDSRVIVPPVSIPTSLPPTDLSSKGLAEPHPDFGGGGSLGGGVVDTAVGIGGAAGGVFTPRLVDKPAAPRPGNPAPIYPSALRAARIEGTVLVRFVVDSAGRAEVASIDFPETTHPQFAEAVRQSLIRSRYLPAMLQGRPVRQLVEQRFAFTLLP
ncbi:MAG TPA: energy transducer TonB [Gemmatimonadaceae bacterium]|nr:energy transducer TonB [Gemmatimonadaceae bacterium]